MANYATYSEGDTYFSNKLHIAPWITATDSEKTKALYEATQIINHLVFSGYLVDADQLNEFPRYYDLDEGPVGDEEIPDAIINACFEIAFALLDGADPDLEYENLGVASQGYSSVRTTYARTNVPEHFANGVPSVTAWRFLKPYLAKTGSVRLRRVS